MDVTYFKYCCFLQLRVVRVKQGQTQLLCVEDSVGVFGKGNPPCNAEDNLHTGYVVTEAWFRGY